MAKLPQLELTRGAFMTVDPRNAAASRRVFLGQALSVGATALVARRLEAQAAAAHPKEAAPAAMPATASAATAPGAATHPALELPPLPYAQNALEPQISANTISYHYGKHHKAYFDKTNTLLQGTPLAGKSLEDVVKGAAKNKALGKLFNNSAQAWNHNFYWQSMKPQAGGAPPAALAARVDKDFGSYDAFKSQFIQTGIDHFSNGWVWLVLDKNKLKIIDTHDADTPLVHGVKPLAVSDVWEHAYYLDYKNVRKDYITGFVDHLLNWDFVAQNLG
jgi:Fe-Mn family superoxide dismutase